MSVVAYLDCTLLPLGFGVVSREYTVVQGQLLLKSVDTQVRSTAFALVYVWGRVFLGTNFSRTWLFHGMASR